MDSQVLPNLSHLAGCQQIMRAIRGHEGFCPLATWLIANSEGAVATIQGIIDDAGLAAIQNLGVLPSYRGLKLGEALLVRAMRGFHSAGATRICLEVTARNEPAIRLYRKFGFRNVRTLYKPVEVSELVSLGGGI
jgi:mycothiol synthase